MIVEQIYLFWQQEKLFQKTSKMISVIGFCDAITKYSGDFYTLDFKMEKKACVKIN